MYDIPLLLIGTATDGPTEELVDVTSESQFLKLFGGYQYTAATLASGTTGTTLGGAAWGNEVRPLRLDTDGAYIDKVLFELTCTGTAVTFSAPGPSMSGVVHFRYQDVPGNSSLIHAYYQARSAGVPITVMRAGGVPATGTVSGFTFQSRYAGTRYNGTIVSVTSTTVTITPATGTGRICTYTPVSDIDLRNRLLIDQDRGRHGIILLGPLSQSAFTVPTGTYTLSGGTNGTFSAGDFLDLLEGYTFEGVNVVCPLGITLADLTGTTVLSNVEAAAYPILIAVQASTSGSALSGTANTSKHICSVGFQTTYRTGTVFETSGHAVPMVAAMLAHDTHNLSNAQLPEGPPTPSYGQALLRLCTTSGHTLHYRSVAKGPSIYRAVTGDSDWPVSRMRALQQLVRAVLEPLENVLGRSGITRSYLERQVDAALSSVTAGTVLDWDLDIRGDTIYAAIRFIPYGEVLVITAAVRLGRISS